MAIKSFVRGPIAVLVGSILLLASPRSHGADAVFTVRGEADEVLLQFDSAGIITFADSLEQNVEDFDDSPGDVPWFVTNDSADTIAAINKTGVFKIAGEVIFNAGTIVADADDAQAFSNSSGAIVAVIRQNGDLETKGGIVSPGPLVMTIESPAHAVAFDSPDITVTGYISDVTATVTVNEDPATLGGISFTATDVPVGTGENEIVVTATRGAETVVRKITVIDVPPLPQEVAPPYDPSLPSDIVVGNTFIAEGPDPIQVDLDTEILEDKRFAILRGKVVEADDEDTSRPLAGVTVTIKDHAEFGFTVTREDGYFDMIVNGGLQYTVVYTREGYLSAQRRVDVAYREIALAPDVALLERAPITGFIDLESTQSYQIVYGQIAYDEDGFRQPIILFPEGTGVTFLVPDPDDPETIDEIEYTTPTLTVRIAEFTEGPLGSFAMPGDLPPSSAFTYAVDLSLDEADEMGAVGVEFDQPLFFYLDNFLSAPKGAAVPFATFDKVKDAWIPDLDGRIIEIVRVDGGLAILDTDDDPDEDNGAGLGITNDERAALVEAYSLVEDSEPGITLWRVETTHFSYKDLNYPEEGELERVRPPKSPLNGVSDASTDCGGCTVEVENQILGESVAIPGTPYSLNYRSSRTQAYRPRYKVNVPLTDSTELESVREVRVEFQIAGRRFWQEFEYASDLSAKFEWDGFDVYGRYLQAPQLLKIKIEYVMEMSYCSRNGELWRSFGLGSQTCIFGGFYLPETSESRRIYLPRRYRTITHLSELPLGSYQASGNPEFDGQNIGGWTLSAHHLYHPDATTIYYGSGAERSLKTEGHYQTFYDPGIDIHEMASAPNGDLYVATSSGLKKIDPAGSVSSITTEGSGEPVDVYVSRNGKIYYISSNSGSYRIYRLESGSDVLLAGGGSTNWGSTPIDDFEGILATDARFSSAGGTGQPEIAVDQDETIYLRVQAGAVGERIYKIMPDGRIYLHAGSGTYEGMDINGRFGKEIIIKAVRAMEIDRQGNLYFNNEHERTGTAPNIFVSEAVVRMDPAGKVQTIVGGIIPAGYSSLSMAGWESALGDGALAEEAFLGLVSSIALAEDGTMFIATMAGTRPTGPSGGSGLAHWNYVASRIRKVAPDGTITTMPGSTRSYNGAQRRIRLALGPNDELFSSMRGYNINSTTGELSLPFDGSVRLWNSLFPDPSSRSLIQNEYFIPSETGSVLYHFDGLGRHLDTIDVVSGRSLLTFNYGATGLIGSLVDDFGTTTTIERDGDTTPTAIIGPFEHRTEIELDPNGYISKLTMPDGAEHTFTYGEFGNLLTYRHPNHAEGVFHAYTYDEDGRLLRYDLPNGGSTSFERSDSDDGFDVTKTSEMGRESRAKAESTPDGSLLRTFTGPDGTISTALIASDDTTTATASDGTIAYSVTTPDPYLGAAASHVSFASVETPSGLRSTSNFDIEYEYNTPNDPSSGIDRITSRSSFNGTAADPFGTGRVTTTEYDADTRTATVTTPMGRTATTEFDAKDMPVEASVPGLDPVATEYDELGRVVRVAQGEGADERESIYTYYDEMSEFYPLLRKVEGPLGDSVEFTEYDEVGRVLESVAEPGHRVFQQSYDEAGLTVSITPPGKPEHAFNYNVVDLIDEYAPPVVSGVSEPQTRHEYNVDKQPTVTRRPDGGKIEADFAEDSGRLDELHLSRDDGAGTVTLTYAMEYYESPSPDAGKIKAVVAPGGPRLDYIYDGPLLKSVEWSGSETTGTVSVTHDNDFRATSLRVNDRDPIEFDINDDGQLTQAGSLSLLYNPTTGFGKGSRLDDVGTTVTYTSFGEVDTYRVFDGGGTIYLADYEYDKLGRIVEVEETVESVTHTYEYEYAEGRLDRVRKDSTLKADYKFDANGNRLARFDGATTTTATYDDQDRMLAYGSAAYAYNEAGDLASKTVGGDVTSYEYDLAGNLRKVTLPDSTEIEYVIDGGNRRIGKKINGASIGGFLYQNGINPVAQIGPGGEVLSEFVYAGGVSPVYAIQGGDEYRIITDSRGSPRLVLDSANGAIVERIDYDEYGAVQTHSVDTLHYPDYVPIPFALAGGLADSDTGLVRFGARDYDPSTGRWTAKDASGLGSGTNLYVYCDDDPLNFIDISGFGKFDARGGGGYSEAASHAVREAYYHVRDFASGAIDGIQISIDKAIPFWDPLSDFYDPADYGCDWKYVDWATDAGGAGIQTLATAGAGLAFTPTSVYTLSNGGKVIYVGISKVPELRRGAHMLNPNGLISSAAKSGFTKLGTLPTRLEARAAEQAVIDYFKIVAPKQLKNIINSIRASHPNYSNLVGQGTQWVRNTGLVPGI